MTPSKSGDVDGITGFDSARIAQHVVSLITLNANQLLAADVSGSNTVTSFDAALIARYVALLPGFGTTGNWIFLPVNRGYANVNASIAAEDYTGLLMGEVSGNWVAPTSFVRNGARLDTNRTGTELANRLNHWQSDSLSRSDLRFL